MKILNSLRTSGIGGLVITWSRQTQNLILWMSFLLRNSLKIKIERLLSSPNLLTQHKLYMSDSLHLDTESWNIPVLMQVQRKRRRLDRILMPGTKWKIRKIITIYWLRRMRFQRGIIYIGLVSLSTMIFHSIQLELFRESVVLTE